MNTAWAAVWHAAGHHAPRSTATGCATPGVAHPGYDAASAFAIDQLVEAGYQPDGADADAVDIAQTHLILAVLACPAIAASRTASPCSTCGGEGTYRGQAEIGTPGSGGRFTCPDCGPTPSVQLDDE